MIKRRRSPGRISGAAIRNLFKKPATISYTGGEMGLDPRNRGCLVYDKSKCIDCLLCMKDCPANAIRIVNTGTKEEKNMHAYLHLGRCIFCCQCVYTCPKDALSFSAKADLAKLKKDALEIEL